nr:hypothetical protein [Limnohabitans sp.]
DQIPGADASSKVVDDLIELSRQRAIAAQRPSVFLRHPGWIAAVLLLIGALVPASGWLQQKWQNGGAQQFWRETAVAPVVETVKMAQAPAAPPVAVMVPADGVAISALPSASAPAPDSVAASVSTVASEAVSVNPLCQSAHAGAAITPARPSKAGDMVYIVAQKMGSVCVVDGAGVRTVLSLKPQEARSVYGAAPWRVNFELPEQAQLYFQGERLRLPDAQLTTVALHEGVRAQ